MDIIKESIKIIKNRHTCIKDLEVGTKIKIIDAGSGARGCDGRIGIITNKPSICGKIQDYDGVNVELITTSNNSYRPKEGRVWKVTLECTFEILTD